VRSLEFSSGLTLEFEPPDPERFPLLPLARQAGERGGTYPCAFNAANEVAVAAFLDGKIGFLDIAGLVEEALAQVDGAPVRDLGELVEADAGARRLAAGRLAVA
jgi:1-deoxy-D-xylulose-5-phosphate reductoisomerase